MSNYKLTPIAQANLLDIRRYTRSRWDNAQWELYFRKLKSSMNLIADNHSIGAPVEELQQDYYRFPLEHHVIYYIRSLLKHIPPLLRAES